MKTMKFKCKGNAEQTVERCNKCYENANAILEHRPRSPYPWWVVREDDGKLIERKIYPDVVLEIMDVFEDFLDEYTGNSSEVHLAGETFDELAGKLKETLKMYRKVR